MTREGIAAGNPSERPSQCKTQAPVQFTQCPSRSRRVPAGRPAQGVREGLHSKGKENTRQRTSGVGSRFQFLRVWLPANYGAAGPALCGGRAPRLRHARTHARARNKEMWRARRCNQVHAGGPSCAHTAGLAPSLAQNADAIRDGSAGAAVARSPPFVREAYLTTFRNRPPASGKRGHVCSHMQMQLDGYDRYNWMME